MPFTEEERTLVETLVQKVVALQTQVNSLDGAVFILQGFVNNHKLTPDFKDQDQETIEGTIRESVSNIIDARGVKKHTHLTDQEGGPAFAKKGAALIESTIPVEEEETP